MSDIQCPRFKSGDFEEWLETFEAFAELKAWDDARKLIVLPLFLEGASKQAYKSLLVAQRATWTLTREALKNVFKPEEDGAESQFRARRQEPNETIASFAAGIRALGSRAFVDHNDVTREKLYLGQFLRGLDRQVAEETIRKSPTTLAEAVTEAQTAWRVKKAIDEIRQNQEGNDAPRPAVGGQVNVLGATIYESIEELKNRVDDLTNIVHKMVVKDSDNNNEEGLRQRRRSEQVRFRSPVYSPARSPARAEPRPTPRSTVRSPVRGAAYDSRRASSPSYPSSRVLSPHDERYDSGRQRRSPRDTERRCYNCGRFGHFSRDCPSRSSRPVQLEDHSGN